MIPKRVIRYLGFLDSWILGFLVQLRPKDIVGVKLTEAGANFYPITGVLRTTASAESLKLSKVFAKAMCFPINQLRI